MYVPLAAATDWDFDVIYPMLGFTKMSTQANISSITASMSVFEHNT